MYIWQLHSSSLISLSTMQSEKPQNTSCMELNLSSGTQPRNPFALQEESISDTHSSGFPNACSIHLHKDVSQPSEQKSGNISSVAERARLKFIAA